MPPIVIAGAIAGGAALFGAHEQSSAAKSAAKTQEASADKALDFSKQVYGDQKQLMSPYVNLGNAAMSRYTDYAAQPFNQRLQNLGQPYSPATAAGGPMARPMSPMPQAAPMSQAPPAMAGGSQAGPMVTIQAPTGETKQVPQQQAQAYVARGARIVPSGAPSPNYSMGPQRVTT